MQWPPHHIPPYRIATTVATTTKATHIQQPTTMPAATSNKNQWQ